MVEERIGSPEERGNSAFRKKKGTNQLRIRAAHVRRLVCAHSKERGREAIFIMPWENQHKTERKPTPSLSGGGN